MKVVSAAICAAAICSTAAIAAQSAYPTQADTDKKKDATVVVTGCVAQGADAKHYTLNNAVVASPMAKTGADAPATPATPEPAGTSGAASASYQLDGGDLKAHVGHKVEVSGTLDKTTTMDHDKMAKPDDKEKTTTARADIGAGKLKVKSVKMLSETCQ
jgi:hypothetical protein